MRFLLPVAFVAAVGVQNPSPTPARDPLSKPAEATASISGRITDADSGRPLPDAIVEVGLLGPVGDGMPRLRRAVSGPEGRFVVDGLAPGEYRVRARSAEFRVTHGAGAFGAPANRLPMDLGKPVVLSAGETRTDIDIQLPRTFAIEGRVLDERGEPMAHVDVHAELLERDARFGFDAVTDDRGAFRVFGLIAGTYRVCGTPLTLFRPAPSAEPVQSWYVTTCFPAAYPAGAGMSDAGVTVTRSDVLGIDIQMQRSGAFTVSGYVLDASGSVAADAQVSISRQERHGSVGVQAETKNGTFTARGVTPGEYRITASSRTDAGPGHFGAMSLRVDGADISGIAVRMSPGARVKGQLVFEGGTLPPAALRRLRVQVMYGPASYAPSPVPAPVAPDLTFELQRIHDPLRVGLGGLPDGWVLKSVWYRGEEVTRRPIGVPSGKSTDILRLIVTNRPARLTVRLLDEQGRLAAGMIAVLLAPDAEGLASGPFLATAREQRDGTMRFGALPPGEYLVAAVRPETLFANRDMERIAATARRITLGDGESREVVLTISTSGGDR